MRNKYNYGELVKVSGIGKDYGKVKNELGFIIEKDNFFDDYKIDLIFGNEDWFKENDIERILGTKKNKTEKYQIRLCTTKNGYNLIRRNIKKNEPISNNKMKKISLFIEFKKDNKKYIILGWNSVYWPLSNKSIKIIESTISSFKNLEIPFQYVVMNEEDIKDIESYEFSDNDKNVKVFSLERIIKIKNLKESLFDDGKDKK